MCVVKYNWSDNDYIKKAINICYSENVGALMPHSHEKLELTYFFNTNTCHYVCGNNIFSLNSNDLVVANPFEIHSCNDFGKNCKVICILIDLKKLNIYSLQQLIFANKFTNNDTLKNIFKQLKDALLSAQTNEPQKECTINSLIYSVLGEISKNTSIVSNSLQKNKNLNVVFDYIEKNLSENISLFDLAQIMHLSVDRFYHVFKESTGICPTEYILAKRIEKSCEFLKNTDMKIAEIAQECNFCTSSYFSKKFKNLMKTTPKQYRKENKMDFFISNK